MTRHTMQAEQVRKYVDHVQRLGLASDPDGQTSKLLSWYPLREPGDLNPEAAAMVARVL